MLTRLFYLNCSGCRSISQELLFCCFTNITIELQNDHDNLRSNPFVEQWVCSRPTTQVALSKLLLFEILFIFIFKLNTSWHFLNSFNNYFVSLPRLVLNEYDQAQKNKHHEQLNNALIRESLASVSLLFPDHQDYKGKIIWDTKKHDYWLSLVKVVMLFGLFQSLLCSQKSRVKRNLLIVSFKLAVISSPCTFLCSDYRRRIHNRNTT